jgi:hypothetical protein
MMIWTYPVMEYELREEYVRLNYLYFLGSVGGGMTVARLALALSNAVIGRVVPSGLKAGTEPLVSSRDEDGSL